MKKRSFKKDLLDFCAVKLPNENKDHQKKRKRQLVQVRKTNNKFAPSII